MSLVSTVHAPLRSTYPATLHGMRTASVVPSNGASDHHMPDRASLRFNTDPPHTCSIGRSTGGRLCQPVSDQLMQRSTATSTLFASETPTPPRTDLELLLVLLPACRAVPRTLESVLAPVSLATTCKHMHIPCLTPSQVHTHATFSLMRGSPCQSPVVVDAAASKKVVPRQSYSLFSIMNLNTPS